MGAKSGRGRKRKSEDTPTASEKKAKKGKAKKGEEEEEPETTFSDYDSAGGSSEPLRKNKGKDSPAKETTTVTSKQQNAVSAALAAGVPAGQQRSVSCVADTSTQREVVVECFAPTTTTDGSTSARSAIRWPPTQSSMPERSDLPTTSFPSS